MLCGAAGVSYEGSLVLGLISAFEKPEAVWILRPNVFFDHAKMAGPLRAAVHYDAGSEWGLDFGCTSSGSTEGCLIQPR